MLSFLEWLGPTGENDRFFLVIDQYTTDPTDRVEAEAHRLQIDLHGTAIRLKWLKYFGEHYGNKCNNELGTRLLLES
jgi:hypothetical protein